MAAMTSKVTAAVAIAGLAATLGACGGDDGDGDKTDVEDAITQLVNSDDPGKCTRYETEEFREQTRFEKDPAEALESCRGNAESNRPADSIDFGEVSVDGDAAEVTFTPDGGDLQGVTATVALVKEGEQWKANKLTKLEIVDRAAFDAEQKAGLTRPPNALPAEQADCYIKNLSRRSDRELEDAFVEGDRTIIDAALRPCLAASDGGDSGGDSGAGADRSNPLRAIFERSLRSGLERQGRPKAQVDCVIERLRKSLSDAEIAAASTGGTSAAVREKSRAAGRACAFAQ